MKRPPSVWCQYGRNTVESLCVSSKSGFKGVLREPPGAFLRHGSKKIQQLDSRIKETVDVLWKFSREIPENPVRCHFWPHVSGYSSAPANSLRHLRRLSGRHWSDVWSTMAVDRQAGLQPVHLEHVWCLLPFYLQQSHKKKTTTFMALWVKVYFPGGAGWQRNTDQLLILFWFLWFYPPQIHLSGPPRLLLRWEIAHALPNMSNEFLPFLE